MNWAFGVWELVCGVHACMRSCPLLPSSLFTDNDGDGRVRGSGAVWGQELKLAKALDTVVTAQ